MVCGGMVVLVFADAEAFTSADRWQIKMATIIHNKCRFLPVVSPPGTGDQTSTTACGVVGVAPWLGVGYSWFCCVIRTNFNAVRPVRPGRPRMMCWLCSWQFNTFSFRSPPGNVLRCDADCLSINMASVCRHFTIGQETIFAHTSHTPRKPCFHLHPVSVKIDPEGCSTTRLN